MLSLGVKKGSRIKIGGNPIKQDQRVVRVEGGTLLTVNDVLSVDEVMVTVGNTVHRVTNTERVEVLPNVYVQTGRDPEVTDHATATTTRLGFEAPKSVRINRVPQGDNGA